MATYLSPKSDASFKKLFGNEHYYDITISFLNSILELKDDRKIKAISFKDTANVKDSLLQANSFVDVHCIDQLDRHFLIEMQIAPQAFFIKRAIYYASLIFSRQLSVIDYNKLMPVIVLTILDHIKFKDHTNVISRYVFIDKVTGSIIPDSYLELHFVELPKFTKTLQELKTDYDEWLFFLQNAATLKSIPQELNSSIFKNAFHVLDKMNWTEDEFSAYIAEMDKADLPNRIERARLDEEREKGMLASQQTTALNFLKLGIAIEIIAQGTGLSIEEIKKIKNRIA